MGSVEGVVGEPMRLMKMQPSGIQNLFAMEGLRDSLLNQTAHTNTA